MHSSTCSPAWPRPVLSLLSGWSDTGQLLPRTRTLLAEPAGRSNSRTLARAVVLLVNGAVPATGSEITIAARPWRGFVARPSCPRRFLCARRPSHGGGAGCQKRGSAASGMTGSPLARTCARASNDGGRSVTIRKGRGNIRGRSAVPVNVLVGAKLRWVRNDLSAPAALKLALDEVYVKPFKNMDIVTDIGTLFRPSPSSKDALGCLWGITHMARSESCGLPDADD